MLNIGSAEHDEYEYAILLKLNWATEQAERKFPLVENLELGAIFVNIWRWREIYFLRELGIFWIPYPGQLWSLRKTYAWMTKETKKRGIDGKVNYFLCISCVIKLQPNISIFTFLSNLSCRENKLQERDVYHRKVFFFFVLSVSYKCEHYECKLCIHAVIHWTNCPFDWISESYWASHVNNKSILSEMSLFCVLLQDSQTEMPIHNYVTVEWY